MKENTLGKKIYRFKYLQYSLMYMPIQIIHEKWVFYLNSIVTLFSVFLFKISSFYVRHVRNWAFYDRSDECPASYVVLTLAHKCLRDTKLDFNLDFDPAGFAQ